MCYEYSSDDFFKEQAVFLTDKMCDRFEKKVNLDHHDLGFLYTLSTVAAYKITKEERYLTISLKVADRLISRFNDNGNFIQAWGEFKDPSENRLIVDSLMNLPLIYWAYETTHNEKYKEVADKHFESVIKNVIREDFTTYHTYYFDCDTGKPTYGVTAQGNRDKSCWARGQAWALTGMSFNSKYQTKMNKELFRNILAVIIDNIPTDGVVYWDFDFTDKNPSSKDVGSNCIIACGLLEEYIKTEDEKDYEMARQLINSIAVKYINHGTKNSITTNSVYSYHEGKGVDESCLWSEYFYMEALMRLHDLDWKAYW